eukprot:1147598-Pelagomonas_calceolata.AAC.3
MSVHWAVRMVECPTGFVTWQIFHPSNQHHDWSPADSHVAYVFCYSSKLSAPQEANVEMSEVQMWKETNRLQTQCLPVAPGTTTIRSLDWGEAVHL